MVSVVGVLTVMVELGGGSRGMHHIGCVMRGYQRGRGPNDFARGFGIWGHDVMITSMSRRRSAQVLLAWPVWR
jgi:hypothetical protein